MSPDVPGTIGRGKHDTTSPYDRRNNMTLNAKNQKKDTVLDDYEDLLNTIEQETQQVDYMSSNAKTGARNSQTSLTQGAMKASDYMKSKMATNTSELASDQINLRSMMVRKDDEPTIDF